MDLREVFAIVLAEEAAECWRVFTYAAAALAAALWFSYLAAKAYPYICEAWDLMGNLRIRRVMVSFAIMFTLFAGAKHGSITYQYTDPEQRYLIDNGSEVTEDGLILDFIRMIAPGDAEFVVDYYPVGTEQEDIPDASENLLWCTFDDFEDEYGQMPAFIPFENATNYNFVAYTTWSPGPSVHTNGVLQLLWSMDASGGGDFVPTRTGIYEDGARLSPKQIPLVIEAVVEPQGGGEEREE